MENVNTNHLLFERLENINPIETSKVSVYSIDDKYRHPPYFRFRFKDLDKNDPIYTYLKLSIDNFVGNLKWELVTKTGTDNYIIIPSIFSKYIGSKDFYRKEKYIYEFSNDMYKKNIDLAIEDLSGLLR